jgi:beta-aspartyl-peptidase (threonine type)
MNISIAVHGGAGTILRSHMTPEKERAYQAALEAAVNTGHQLLAAGGSAWDAVAAAVVVLEDSPLFNAGRGAVFTHDGTHELDASIMDGRDQSGGAVAGVHLVRNPILLARLVRERSEHVLLTGAGAEAFARLHGVAFEPVEYFHTAQRWEQLQEALKDDSIRMDHSDDKDEKKFGTVGAVARDAQGNLAAATSTGGMTNKKWGRVGDTPILGAGTYANNATCAISCTGHGEYFIRSVVAYDVHCMMEYKGLPLAEAVRTVVHDKLVKIGGEGGLIAVDAQGNVVLDFNSEGMYRAKRVGMGEVVAEIYR